MATAIVVRLCFWQHLHVTVRNGTIERQQQQQRIPIAKPQSAATFLCACPPAVTCQYARHFKHFNLMTRKEENYKVCE